MSYPVPLSQAATDVIAERDRQATEEGYTAEHDDDHREGELALAAACYAAKHRVEIVPAGEPAFFTEDGFMRWPWEWPGLKPKDRRLELVVAGALILAEIERLDRAKERARQPRQLRRRS